MNLQDKIVQVIENGEYIDSSYFDGEGDAIEAEKYDTREVVKKVRALFNEQHSKLGVNVCTNAMTTQDKEYIDQIINLETKRKIARVDPKNDFGIITACMIDGEFVLSSCHDVPMDWIEEFKNA